MYLVFSKENCPQCTQLENMLEAEQKEFDIKKLGVDFSRDDLVNMFNSMGKPLPRSFPVLFRDGEFIGGLVEARKLQVSGQL